ncbi:MAG: class IV adenylate cyclase, partial [Candidatus Dormibacteraceae bacterium]
GASVETEVKIEVAALDPIRDRLRALGARCLSVVDEDNQYFDRKGELAALDQSLRLRKDERVRLTWKGASAFRDGVVVRPEVEVTVSCFDDLAEILRHLGFRPAERLAKHRETWALGGVEIALDSLAFGHFVEIEGDRDAIDRVARGLGLDVGQGVGVSYRRLQRERRSAGSV